MTALNTDNGFMEIDDAIELVLELARGNIIDDPDMSEEAGRQTTACNVLEDFAVNVIGEGRLKPQWRTEDDGSQTCLQRCFQIGTLLIAGRAVLMSNDGRGETTACGLSLADAMKPVSWLPDDVDYTPPDPVIQSFDTFDEMQAALAKMHG